MRTGARGGGGTIPAVSGAAGAASTLFGAPGQVIGGGPQEAVLFGASPQEYMSAEWVKKTMAAAQLEREAMPIRQQMALQEYQSSVGTRIQARRLMGMKGLHFDPKAGAIDEKTGQPKGGWSDPFGEAEVALIAKGYGMDAKMAAAQQARSLGGDRFASQFAGTIMGATGAGYGQVGDVLAAAARGGGTAQATALTQGVLGGGINTLAGLQLGQALFGFNPQGTISGAGALSAFQQGFQLTGGIEDLNEVQRALGGLKALTMQAQGFDPYSRGQNVLSAARILGPGASPRDIDLLTRIRSEELMEVEAGGRGSGLSRALGLKPEEARKYLEDIDPLRRAAAIGSRPVDMAVQAWRRSGMSRSDYSVMLGKVAQQRDKKGHATQEAQRAQAQIENLAAAVMLEQPGISYEEALGEEKFRAGLAKDRGLKKGAVPYGGVSGAEKEYQEGLA
ncbi:MAG: hypothetical protein ACREMO_00400, partial [Gemmatimonadales bacterium]